MRQLEPEGGYYVQDGYDDAANPDLGLAMTKLRSAFPSKRDAGGRRFDDAALKRRKRRAANRTRSRNRR